MDDFKQMKVFESPGGSVVVEDRHGGNEATRLWLVWSVQRRPRAAARTRAIRIVMGVAV